MMETSVCFAESSDCKTLNLGQPPATASCNDGMPLGRKSRSYTCCLRDGDQSRCDSSASFPAEDLDTLNKGSKPSCRLSGKKKSE